MSEFIGSRISLISRSDIRYVGILHEINSENSTVALEQVVSFGTEGRRRDPAKEIPATDNVYEYIVFRGSDVKDLRIEEPAKPQQQKPPQVPDDPAILQSTARPPGYPPQGLPQYPAPPIHSYYQQNPTARYGYPPNPYGYPGYPPVAPPGAVQFPPQAPQQASQQAPQQAPPAQQQQQPQPIGPYTRQVPHPQAPIGPAASRVQQSQSQAPQQLIAPRGALQQALQPQAQHAPKPSEQQPKPTTPVKLPVSVAAQDDVKAAPQPPPAPQVKEQGGTLANDAIAGAKGRGGIVPALPLAPPPRQGVPGLTSSVAPAIANDAVAASASKSASEIGDTTAAVQDLAHKVNQLKASSTAATSNGETSTPAAADNSHRPARQPTNRGRGGFRAGFQQLRKVEIPAGDFDFESANAKFNKQDLIKEVIAAEDVPVPTNGSVTNGGATAEEEAKDHSTATLQPDGFYSKKKSFFDNISCENKERAEAKEGDKPRGGAQWRGEETKKNIETFGQGSVDGGNRYMGRGGWRGRGRGYRGYRGRGGMRGNAF